MTEPAAPETKSFWQIVWEQFRGKRLASRALVGVSGLLVLAVLAPAVASNHPFLWHTAEEGWSSPWLVSLFDRNFYASNIDVVFNGIMLAAPLLTLGLLLAWRLTRGRPARARRRARGGALGAALLVQAALAVGLVAFPYSREHVDWVERDAALTAEGVEHVAIFPLVRSSHRDGEMKDQFQDPSGEHWLGTDHEGRDVFTRLLFGTRISLTVGVFAVGLYCTFGVLIGALAGYAGGRVDALVQALIEIILCIPTIFLLLGAAAFIRDRTIFHIIGIIAAVSWTTPARLVRAEFLKLRGQDFVTAAVAAGFPPWRIALREVLPNAVNPVLVTATFGVGATITLEATMSFLGLGDANAPSWGLMLSAGREFGDWTLILAPAAAILVTVSLLNLVGEGMRDALDPKLRH